MAHLVLWIDEGSVSIIDHKLIKMPVKRNTDVDLHLPGTAVVAKFPGMAGTYPALILANGGKNQLDDC